MNCWVLLFYLDFLVKHGMSSGGQTLVKKTKMTGFYAASASRLSIPLLETCMRPTGHVWCLHFYVLYFLLRYCSFLEGYWCLLLLGQGAFAGHLSSGHLYESAWIGRAGQGAPQTADHCLMSTRSAAGWISLASLCGCMSHISTSLSGQDRKRCTAFLVGLLRGVTLKAAFKRAVQMLLMSALLWSRAGLGVQLGTRADSHNLAASPSLRENLDYPKIFMSTDWPHTAVPAWEPNVNCWWTVCGCLFVTLR